MLHACHQVQNNRLTDEQITQELRRIYEFDEGLSDKKQDLIRVAKFLSNEHEVLKQLEHLEKSLQAHAGERFNEETQLLEGFKEGEVFKHQKLLSSYLCEWAKHNGFKGYARLKSIMSIKTFFSVIESGALFQDNVFQGHTHGDFSHFIQWVLITNWNNEDPQKPQLKTPPPALYQWIGKKKSPLYWENTFESPSISSLYKPAQRDFRRVEVLHQYLLSPECKFPVLHQLTSGRAAKGERALINDQIDEFTLVPFNP